MSAWTRVHGDQGTGTSFSVDAATIPAGQTLLRVHAGVVLRARLPAVADPNAVAQYIIAAGWYVRPASGGAVWHPVTNANSAATDTQRWLWWRPMALIPVPAGTSELGAYWTWSSETAPEEIDIKAMTLATPGNVTLAISWEQASTQPSGATVTISWWAAALIG